ncbi:MAG: hypothetical protein RL090_1153 [Bacteroidota bacterium]|jgi:hypothetical protein
MDLYFSHTHFLRGFHRKFIKLDLALACLWYCAARHRQANEFNKANQTKTPNKQNNMKKIIYSLFIVLGSSLCASAQDDQKVAEDPNAPEIVFEKDVHDFGTIEYGGDGKYEFKFSNTGKSPLIITNARGSCGCTVPTWPKEAIGKGQSGSIKVEYDTKRPGPFTKTVTISSNGKTKEKVITIKGNVTQPDTTPDQTPLKKDNTAAPVENK